MTRKRPKVAALVARFVQITKFDTTAATGEDAVGMLVRLREEAAALDETECMIVELKRGGRISAKKMVQLLRNHQKDIRGGADA